MEYFEAYADDRAFDRESDWKRIMKLDFEDLPVLHKGKDGLKVDMRLDGDGRRGKHFQALLRSDFSCLAYD